VIKAAKRDGFAAAMFSPRSGKPMLVATGKVTFLIAGFENGSVLNDDAQATGETYLPEKLRDALREKFGVANPAAKFDKGRFVRRKCVLFHVLLLAQLVICVSKKTLSVTEQEVN
jgi:hypothetical protein